MLQWMTLYMQLLRWAEVRISIVLSYVSFFFQSVIIYREAT